MLIEFLYVISCRFPDDMALIDVQQDFYRKCHIIQNTVGSVDGLLIYDCVIAWPRKSRVDNTISTDQFMPLSTPLDLRTLILAVIFTV